MARVTRGSIVLVRYPFTDLSAVKRRPALAVSSDARADDDVILAFITSRVVVAEPTDFLIDAGDPDFASSGLRTSSLIRCDKLMTLNRTLLSGRLGLLSGRLMTEVNARLRLALDLNSD